MPSERINSGSEGMAIVALAALSIGMGSPIPVYEPSRKVHPVAQYTPDPEPPKKKRNRSAKKAAQKKARGKVKG